MAFVPEPGARGQCRQADVERRVAEILRYARASGELQVMGFRVAVRSDRGGTSASNGVKRTLKHAKRVCGLRCVAVTRPAPGSRRS